MSILNKRILYILMLTLPLVTLSQKDKAKIWENEKEYLDYRKSDKYKGPDEWYGSNPANMKEEDYVSSNNNSNNSTYNPGIQYSPQQIQKDRQKRYQGFDRGGSNGTLPFDPEVEKPDPLDLPDFDAPDVPDIDLPDVDPPSIPPGVWKALLFILIFVILFILARLILKNQRPANKRLIVEVENDWNPEVISKSELDIRLEEAIEKGDYRECVRIYFTFILKELIRKSWITWRKEKTNYHYVLEMSKRPNANSFNECVRIYDLVWYGEYQIDEEIFELISPILEEYYKSLDPINE